MNVSKQKWKKLASLSWKVSTLSIIRSLPKRWSHPLKIYGALLVAIATIFTTIDSGSASGVTAQNSRVYTKVVRNGDVSCNGKSDAADALLMLQYNISLRDGTDSCEGQPRGDTTLFLPACDINEDGFCNAIDALLTLQCANGTTNSACPADDGDTNSNIFENEDNENEAPAQINVSSIPAGITGRVRLYLEANLGKNRLGAATLAIKYDASLLQARLCEANPESMFSLGSCNAKFAQDEVRLTVLNVQGVSGNQILANLTFDVVGIISQDTLLTVEIESLVDHKVRPLSATIQNDIVRNIVSEILLDNIFSPFVFR